MPYAKTPGIRIFLQRLYTLYESKSMDVGYFNLIFNDFSGRRHFVSCSGCSSKPLDLMEEMIEYIRNHSILIRMDTVIDFESRHDEHITVPPPPKNLIIRRR